jgi:hypothetical protein
MLPFVCCSFLRLWTGVVRVAVSDRIAASDPRKRREVVLRQQTRFAAEHVTELALRNCQACV